MATYSKILISSEERDLSALYVADPDEVSGESGELYIYVGKDEQYSVPEEFLDKPQQWRDKWNSPYPSVDEYFSNSFTQKGEIWIVCHWLEDDRKTHQLVRYKIRYNGESEKKLFELFYKIYKISVYCFEYPTGQSHITPQGKIEVRTFEENSSEDFPNPVSQHTLEQDLELEPLFYR